MEFCATLSEVGIDLLGSSDTGVDVGLGGLCTHLLGSAEIASLKLGKFCVSVGLDVGHKLQVFTLSHEFDEFRLVDHLFASGVHQDTTLAHHAYEIVVDALLGFGSGRDVERNHVAGLEELVLRVNSVNASLFDDILGAESVVGINLHAEAFGNASHVAANVTESQDTEFLAHELCTGLAVVEVSHGKNHHTEHEFGNGIGVLSGSVLHNNALVFGISGVDVVVAGTGTNNDFQVGGSVEHLRSNLVRANDERIGILHGIEQLSLFCIFFEQYEFIACTFDFFSDALYSNCCKRFFCCN